MPRIWPQALCLGGCMEWLGHLFEKYPEMAVYLAIGLGYLIGGLKFRGAVAFGHILLTTCGTLIIALLS